MSLSKREWEDWVSSPTGAHSPGMTRIVLLPKFGGAQNLQRGRGTGQGTGRGDTNFHCAFTTLGFSPP